MQPPDNAGPRALFPFPVQRHSREARDDAAQQASAQSTRGCRWRRSSSPGRHVVIRNTFFAPTTITAYFTTATAIYPGDDVRVSGVKVGTIAAIRPEGTQTKLTMHVDHDVPIPADAKAVIVAQNLVAARYVQLTPAYRTSGPDHGRRRGDTGRPDRDTRRVGRGERPN